MDIEQREERAAASAEGVRARRPEPNGGGGAAEPEAGAAPHGPPRSVLREYFESLVVTAIMAIFGMTFIVQAVKVPTGSMQNTILIGDHLLVNKFIFAPGPVVPFLPQRDIRRGDVIVFKYPGKSTLPQFEKYDTHDDDPTNIPFKTNYVKRVIGLPGDHIEIKGTEVFVNKELLPEQRIAAVNPPDREDNDDLNGDERGAPLSDERGHPLTGANAPPRGESHTVYWGPETLAGGAPHNIGETRFDVPPGHYFTMGDNRENSQDGRFWGYVPRELVVGRAMFVYWSFDESAPRSSLTFPLNHVADFFTNTRWSRTGTLVR